MAFNPLTKLQCCTTSDGAAILASEDLGLGGAAVVTMYRKADVG